MESLRVIHLPKRADTDPGLGARLHLPNAFHLNSCQRLLWACRASVLEGVAVPAGFEVYEGADAYRFLLRVATGLESQIVGETDIFGQLKEAWRKCPAEAELDVLHQKLFEDTKDVRARFLQNLGGASYGSLVRMMLKQSPGPRLLVGAGQLAHSVAPYLLDQELWLVNRGAEKRDELYRALLERCASQGIAPRIRIVSREEELGAWREAASVVVCIPLDPAPGEDPARIDARRGHAGPVIHLGCQRAEAEAAGWRELPGFEALDDLFTLQKAQGDVRVTQVQQAARACDEKAKLRSLGASVTLPHGWEDLALFA